MDVKEWTALATVLVALLALVVAILAYMHSHKTQRYVERNAEKERVRSLRDQWGQVKKKRGIFWPAAREAYQQYREGHSDLPAEIESFIGSAGMPPGLPLEPNQELRAWYSTWGARLTPSQRHILNFAVTIYPPRRNGEVDFLAGSVIANDKIEEFHEARNELASYFQAAKEDLGVEGLADLLQRNPLNDVALLSWLELALIQGTQDDGPGRKSGMFEYGNHLWGLGFKVPT